MKCFFKSIKIPPYVLSHHHGYTDISANQVLDFKAIYFIVLEYVQETCMTDRHVNVWKKMVQGTMYLIPIFKRITFIVTDK